MDDFFLRQILQAGIVGGILAAISYGAALIFQKIFKFKGGVKNKYFPIVMMIMMLCGYVSLKVLPLFIHKVSHQNTSKQQFCAQAEDGKKQCFEITLLRQMADHGDTEAQRGLGIAYYTGNSVGKDYKEAVKWWRKAAEQGNAGAQHNLGGAYYEGNGVGKDYKEAVKWFRKAAEQGNPDAQYLLGDAYINGTGVDQDFEEAVNWLRKAADQKNADAQMLLGAAYLGGKGVEQDFTEAEKWLRMAAEQGNTDAIEIYNREIVDKTISLLRPEADQGNAQAQLRLGTAYYAGLGDEKYYKEAVKWWQKAANQGDADAQNLLNKYTK